MGSNPPTYNYSWGLLWLTHACTNFNEGIAWEAKTRPRPKGLLSTNFHPFNGYMLAPHRYHWDFAWVDKGGLLQYAPMSWITATYYFIISEEKNLKQSSCTVLFSLIFSHSFCPHILLNHSFLQPERNFGSNWTILRKGHSLTDGLTSFTNLQSHKG